MVKNYDDMLSRFYLIPKRYGRTDGRTDRRTDLLLISRVSMLTFDKKLEMNYENCLHLIFLQLQTVSSSSVLEVHRPIPSQCTCMKKVFRISIQENFQSLSLCLLQRNRATSVSLIGLVLPLLKPNLDPTRFYRWGREACLVKMFVDRLSYRYSLFVSCVISKLCVLPRWFRLVQLCKLHQPSIG